MQTIIMLIVSICTVSALLWMKMSKRKDIKRIRQGNATAHNALICASVLRVVYALCCITRLFSSSASAAVAIERTLWSSAFATTYIGYGLVAQRVMLLVRKSLQWHKKMSTNKILQRYPAVALSALQIPAVLWPFLSWAAGDLQFTSLVYGWAVYFGTTVFALNIYLFAQVQAFMRIVKSSQKKVNKAASKSHDAVSSAAIQLRLIRGMTVGLSVVFLSVVVLGIALDMASTVKRFEVYELLLSLPQCLAVVGMTVVMSPIAKRLQRVSSMMSGDNTATTTTTVSNKPLTR